MNATFPFCLRNFSRAFYMYLSDQVLVLQKSISASTRRDLKGLSRLIIEISVF